MKTPLSIFGIVAIVIGAIWIGQGTGYFPYPRSSFMVSQVQWAYYGAILAAIGAIIVVLSRRR